MGFPCCSDGKVSVHNAGDEGLILGLGRSHGEGNGSPLQYSSWRIPWMEEAGRLQSMGHKESDMTERLHFHFRIVINQYL